MLHRENLANEATVLIRGEKAKVAQVQAQGEARVAKRKNHVAIEKVTFDDANMRQTGLDGKAERAEREVAHRAKMLNQTEAELKHTEVRIENVKASVPELEAHISQAHKDIIHTTAKLLNATAATELAKEKAKGVEQTLELEKQAVAHKQEALKKFEEVWSEEKATIVGRVKATSEELNHTQAQLNQAEEAHTISQSELEDSVEQAKAATENQTQADNVAMDAGADVQTRVDEEAGAAQAYALARDKSLLADKAAEDASTDYTDAQQALVEDQSELKTAEEEVAKRVEHKDHAKQGLAEAKLQAQQAADHLSAANKAELDAVRASEKAEALHVSKRKAESEAEAEKTAAEAANVDAAQQLSDANDAAAHKAQLEADAQSSSQDKNQALDMARTAFAAARKVEIQTKHELADQHKIKVDLTTPVHDSR